MQYPCSPFQGLLPNRAPLVAESNQKDEQLPSSSHFRLTLQTLPASSACAALLQGPSQTLFSPAGSPLPLSCFAPCFRWLHPTFQGRNLGREQTGANQLWGCCEQMFREATKFDRGSPRKGNWHIESVKQKSPMATRKVAPTLPGSHLESEHSRSTLLGPRHRVPPQPKPGSLPGSAPGLR